MEELELYTILATVLDKVSDLLKLNSFKMQLIKDRHHHDPEKCIRDVINTWILDGRSLSCNYKCTWNGLCLLLKDVQLSSIADDLEDALSAEISSFNDNWTANEKDGMF